MSNTHQAEIYYLKAEKLYRELSDSLGIARIDYRICSIYVMGEDYPKALQYGQEAYRILSAMSYVRAFDMYSALRSLSDVWFRIPDYNKALEYALMSVESARQTYRQDVMAASLQALAQCYLKQEKYKEAEKTAFEALAIDSSKMQINTGLYQVIAESNIGLKNSRKALDYFHKTIETKNAYSNQNFQNSISEMEVKYETEKKELQIAALKDEKRLMSWLSIAGGGVLLLGLAALFFLWRWTQQKRRLAESQIKQIEQEKQIIATQAVLDGEVQERTRLARDLHDGMGGKLTAMKIYLEKLKQSAKLDNNEVEQFRNAMDMLDDSVQEMRRVSHNLMPDTLSRAGLKPAVDDFCRSMSSQIVFNYYGEETRLDLKLEALIYRCISELVNNALKYAGASQILVQIVREADCISFTVEDNGCGFDPTAETQGIGLQNIRTRVASFGGDMQIDSKVGEGTEINVELRIES
jgi:signal transduction histidine kinase